MVDGLDIGAVAILALIVVDTVRLGGRHRRVREPRPVHCRQRDDDQQPGVVHRRMQGRSRMTINA